MTEMKQLQDEFSKALDDAKTISKKMTRIARGEEWSVSAFQDFESIERYLEKADKYFAETPSEPDNPDAEPVFEEEDDQ